MEHSHRRLLVVCYVCVTVLVIAVIIKFAGGVYNQSKETQKKIASQKTATREEIQTDSSFFENELFTQKIIEDVKRKYIESFVDMEKKIAKPEDSIGAKAYLVGDVNTGKVYLSRNIAQALPVASMSKLVTAFVSTDLIKKDAVISITEEEMKLPQDGSLIMAGEKFTMNELLYPLLLNSSNIAAEALASATGRSSFLENMSSYSWEIGMPKTFFADASGLSPNNAASAEDLFELAKYLYKYRPDILAITRTIKTSVSTTTDHGAHNFTNIHPFVMDVDFIGGKTGHTPQAGDTMLTIINIKNKPIAIVVLGSGKGEREKDTRILIDIYKKQNKI